MENLDYNPNDGQQAYHFIDGYNDCKYTITEYGVMAALLKYEQAVGPSFKWEAYREGFLECLNNSTATTNQVVGNPIVFEENQLAKLHTDAIALAVKNEVPFTFFGLNGNFECYSGGRKTEVWPF